MYSVALPPRPISRRIAYWPAITDPELEAICMRAVALQPSDRYPSALAMLSDIFPTGFECGVLNGQVKPGDTILVHAAAGRAQPADR